LKFIYRGRGGKRKGETFYWTAGRGGCTSIRDFAPEKGKEKKSTTKKKEKKKYGLLTLSSLLVFQKRGGKRAGERGGGRSEVNGSVYGGGLGGEGWKGKKER